MKPTPFKSPLILVTLFAFSFALVAMGFGQGPRGYFSPIGDQLDTVPKAKKNRTKSERPG